MKYNNLVLSHFFEPKNVGTLDVKGPWVVYSQQGQSRGGDRLDFYLESDENGLIRDAAFKAYGNPYLIAAASLMSEEVSRVSLDEASSKGFMYLVDTLSIPSTKVYCAILVEEAVKHCIKVLKERIRGAS